MTTPAYRGRPVPDPDRVRRRMVLLAEGRFGPLTSKTANQAIRYLGDEVVAVIDSTRAGSTAGEQLGYGGPIPVVADLPAAMRFEPSVLLIGIAPAGGLLPEGWRPVILDALNRGLHIVSGLHTHLGADPEFSACAKASRTSITDLRLVPGNHLAVSKGLWRGRKAKTILTVGTDCNVGKMTASLELHNEFLRRGITSDFVATGQTGILLAGRGVAVDAVPGDYIAGAIETELSERDMEAGFLHVEGQGALTHQGYSAVTAGLLHGVMPDAMILVHHPARRRDDYGRSLDDLPGIIALYEAFVQPFRRSKVAGIAVNPALMTGAETAAAMEDIRQSTGLPVANVRTPGIGLLADALLEYLHSCAPADQGGAEKQ